jgi:nucleotide-binding universal stress UspA family protein
MSVQTDVFDVGHDETLRQMPVIVGYDGSPESKLAVQIAAERAGPGGTVVAVHVTMPASDWLGSSSYEPIVEHTHHAAQILLAELEDLDVGEATVEPELIEGKPAEALLRVARGRDAREIVVGSRGLGPFRSLLGSTSHALLERADRPVVIVPRGALYDDR